MDPLYLFIITIFLAYTYAFVGGFTDASNAIATSIGTRALSPRTAVVMAGILEIVGALTGTAVALTIGKDIVSLELITLYTVPAALLGTMVWSLFTYYFGIPVSETHGLIGGIIGASIAVSGTSVVQWSGVIKVLLAIIISPLLGFFGGIIFMIPIYRYFSSSPPSRMKPLFTNLQRFSAAFMAFSHGRNDAQKPMGVIVMAMALYFGWAEMSVPIWIILTVGFTAGVGVAMGGWRIIRTLGSKIVKLRPEQGFAAETSAAFVLQLASILGIPVSTTHTITSSIVGVGTMRGFSRVRWGVVRDIVYSWVLTLPATITLGWIFSYLFGFVL